MSEARNAAALPTSASVVTRPNRDLASMAASISSVEADQPSVETPSQLSGIPSDRRQFTRMPRGTNSAANCFVRDSIAAQAAPTPPTQQPGTYARTDEEESDRITP